ncbi:MAG: hypothetical protein IPJ65_03785 [Archangiaceae bacterium]|nr:hypothetical protein [Archangiaceae bacterium]
MKKNLVVVAVTVAMSGCGLPENEPGAASAPAAEQTRQALNTCGPLGPTPPTPAAPTDLTVWLRTHPQLFPLGVRSAYAAVQQDPADARRFLAFGYDVAAGRNIFFVSGSIATDYGKLTQNLAEGLVENNNKNYTFMGGAVFGQVAKPPKGGGGGYPDGPYAICAGAFFLNNP